MCTAPAPQSQPPTFLKRLITLVLFKIFFTLIRSLLLKFENAKALSKMLLNSKMPLSRLGNCSPRKIFILTFRAPQDWLYPILQWECHKFSDASVVFQPTRPAQGPTPVPPPSHSVLSSSCSSLEGSPRISSYVWTPPKLYGLAQGTSPGSLPISSRRMILLVSLIFFQSPTSPVVASQAFLWTPFPLS